MNRPFKPRLSALIATIATIKIDELPPTQFAIVLDNLKTLILLGIELDDYEGVRDLSILICKMNDMKPSD